MVGYFLYKEGSGYRMRNGNHTMRTSEAQKFNTYMEAWNFRASNGLQDYQIQELA